MKSSKFVVLRVKGKLHLRSVRIPLGRDGDWRDSEQDQDHSQGAGKKGTTAVLPRQLDGTRLQGPKRSSSPAQLYTNHSQTPGGYIASGATAYHAFLKLSCQNEKERS